MWYRHRLPRGLPVLIATCVVIVNASAAPAETSGLPKNDRWDDIDMATHAPVSPTVPLPSSVYGSAACVLLMVALRYSRHRRWVTLR